MEGVTLSATLNALTVAWYHRSNEKVSLTFLGSRLCHHSKRLWAQDSC